jgi:hypothetical protein
MKIILNEGCYIINQSNKADQATAEHLQSLTANTKKVVKTKLTLAERTDIANAKGSFKRENPNYKHNSKLIFKAY